MSESLQPQVSRNAVRIGAASVLAAGAGFGLAALFPGPPEGAAWRVPDSIAAGARPAGATAPRAKPEPVRLDVPEDTGSRARFLRGKVKDIAQSDPASAILTANAYASGLPLARLYRSICEVWAAHDPAAALEWCRTLGPDARPVALEGVLGALAGQDSPLALDLLLTLPPEDRSSRMADDVAMAVLSTGDLEASVALLEHEDDELRLRAWSNLGRLAEHHPDRALELLAEPDPGLAQHQVERLVLEINIDHFPARLLSEVLAADEFEGRDSIVWRALESLAATDLKAALQIEVNLPEELRNERLAARLVDAATGNRGGNHSPIGSLPTEARMRIEAREADYFALMQTIGEVYGPLPPPGVIDGLSGAAPSRRTSIELSESIIGALRTSGRAGDYGHQISSAFQMLMVLDPGSAREIATAIARDAQGDAPSVSPTVLYHALRYLQESDPGTVADIVGNIRDDQLRPPALKLALRAQIAADPVGAARWAEALPASEVPREAPERLAAETRFRDPHLSLAWALRIDDPGRKTGSVAETLRAWAAIDPEAARSAVGTLGLPADQAEALVQLIDREL